MVAQRRFHGTIAWCAAAWSAVRVKKLEGKPKKVRRVSKKTKRAGSVPKTGAVWHLSAEEATLAKKPRYNGYACGHGAHGDAKYNRAKQKRAWKSAIRQEGTPRGPFLVSCLSVGA